MSNANAINAELYRKIESGKQYEKYMPFSDCSSVKLADGDTKVAIDNMAKWANKYRHHTKKLAVIFAKQGLEETCGNLHSFLYNHFQYKIDGFKQNLRSPACSWATRNEGIDCKSYSIFASTVLLNLGISHYLRRIKQNKNEGFSHVYINVPVNQKQPKKLEDGYYTIDGTLSFTSEPLYYEKDDVFMEAKLPIYGLSGIKEQEKGLGYFTIILSAVMPLIQTFVSDLVKDINSCNGTRFDAARVSFKLENELKPSLERKFKEIDTGIFMQNKSVIQRGFNDLFRDLDLGFQHLKNEYSLSSNDHCDGQILLASIKYISKIKEVVEKMYRNFIKSNTRFEVEEFEKTDLTSKRDLYFVVGKGENPINASYRYIVLRDKEKKYEVDIIFPFEENSDKWIGKNIQYLKNNYGVSVASGYEKEVKPILEQINNLRKKYYFGGEMLYYFEQPLHRKLYKIWLKYDLKYNEYLKKEAESLKTANELALKEFKKRYEKEVEEDKKAKKRKRVKLQIGLAGVVFSSFWLLDKKKTKKSYE